MPKTCTTTNHGRVKWNGGNIVCLACGSYLCWVLLAERDDEDGVRTHRCGKSDGHNTTSDTVHECACGTTW